MVLNIKPMNGTNYSKWKTNIYIILDYEKIKFFLTTPKPNEHAVDEFEETKTQYSEWKKANTADYYYILASVSSSRL